MSKRKRLPALPRLLQSKFYKTGQTRGADDDVIFQNRVNRNSTVLIPYLNFESCKNAPENNGIYEGGYIVLVNPRSYFEDKGFKGVMNSKGLKLGENALLFYYSRSQWNEHNPEKKNLTPATSRTSPLGGQYIARVPDTTASKDKKIRRGFTTSKLKGAGIRVYEYASPAMIKNCRIQLEYIYWLCKDSLEVSIKEGMTKENAQARKKANESIAKELGLADNEKLKKVRIINKNNCTVCPLCLEEISAAGFFRKVKQAKGREVADLTVTKLNLFHIEELRTGEFNHRIYNLGWGHHHCNIVVKDAGIHETLFWMNEVIERNKKFGFKS